MSPVHVRAEPGDIAESVLMPGDPRRAMYIAENYFDYAELVTEERGMLGPASADEVRVDPGRLAGLDLRLREARG